MSTPKLLVIVGHQGSGGTQYARKLAAERGTYVEASPEDLVRKLTSILVGRPAVIIIDEPPSTMRQLGALKNLLRTETFLIKDQGRNEVKAPSPFVIITTNNESFLSLLQRDPHSVVRISSAAPNLH